jgi:hypothetical protein
MVVIEVLLVAALLFVTWRIWEDRQHPTAGPAAVVAPPPGSGPSRSTSTPAPLPTVPGGAPSPGPTVGLRQDPAFLLDQMRRIGDDEAAMERTQWQLVDAFTGWARRYIEDVVVPAARAAEAP